MVLSADRDGDPMDPTRSDATQIHAGRAIRRNDMSYCFKPTRGAVDLFHRVVDSFALPALHSDFAVLGVRVEHDLLNRDDDDVGRTSDEGIAEFFARIFALRARISPKPEARRPREIVNEGFRRCHLPVHGLSRPPFERRLSLWWGASRSRGEHLFVCLGPAAAGLVRPHPSTAIV